MVDRDVRVVHDTINSTFPCDSNHDYSVADPDLTCDDRDTLLDGHIQIKKGDSTVHVLSMECVKIVCERTAGGQHVMELMRGSEFAYPKQHM